MLWFFQRAEEITRLETRFENTSGEYLLVIEAPGLGRTAERFSNVEAFQARVLALEAKLKADNWTQHGEPQILPDGWRGPTT